MRCPIFRYIAQILDYGCTGIARMSHCEQDEFLEAVLRSKEKHESEENANELAVGGADENVNSEGGEGTIRQAEHCMPQRQPQSTTRQD